MANTTNIQILNDGYRDATIKFEGVLDTSDITSATTLIDPASLGAIDSIGTKASYVRINRINFDVEDALAVNLFWDAATPAPIWNLVGRGEIKAKPFVGLTNNATSPTGIITYTTQGWNSTILSFTIILELVKY